jgi:uncharacterized protein (TIGR02246 family)
MKEKTLSVLFLIVVSMTCMAADPASDFKAAVEAATKNFETAISAKDPVALGAVYASDAIIFPPNSEQVQGKEAISAYWKGIMDGGMTAKIEPTEVESDGNLGMDSGKFKILGSDGKQIDHGKYVVVWKKENGAWKIYRDIWNTNVASTPTAESK